MIRDYRQDKRLTESWHATEQLGRNAIPYPKFGEIPRRAAVKLPTNGQTVRSVNRRAAAIFREALGSAL